MDFIFLFSEKNTLEKWTCQTKCFHMLRHYFHFFLIHTFYMERYKVRWIVHSIKLIQNSMFIL